MFVFFFLAAVVVVVDNNISKILVCLERFATAVDQ